MERRPARDSSACFCKAVLMWAEGGDTERAREDPPRRLESELVYPLVTRELLLLLLLMTPAL